METFWICGTGQRRVDYCAPIDMKFPKEYGQMTNISVDGPLVVFRPGRDDARDACDDIPLDVLNARELAERAAAKNSASVEARRVHQELALMYASRRYRSKSRP